MVIVRGALPARHQAAGRSSLFTLPPEFKFIGQGIVRRRSPSSSCIFVVFVVVFDFLLRRATAFRKVFYTGSNEKAAAYSGIRTKRVILATTVLCSTLARLRRHHLHGALRLGAADLRRRHGAQHHRRGGDRRGEPVRRLGHDLRRDPRRGAAVGGDELARPAQRLGLLAGHHPRLDPARCRVVRPSTFTSARRGEEPMRISNDVPATEAERQIHSVLVMHFLEGITQAEIAELTNLSHAKVNRLIKQGRDSWAWSRSTSAAGTRPCSTWRAASGEATGLETVRITPTASTNPQTHPAAGRRRRRQPAARDWSRTATRSASPAARASAPSSRRSLPTAAMRVEVVPATGCVQGKHYTDVNHVATQMAEQLGGEAFLIHAPLFADSVAERDMLMGMKVGHRRLRPRAPRPGRGARHRLDPVGRFQLLRPASGSRATTAPASRRPAPRASCWRI